MPCLFVRTAVRPKEHPEQADRHSPDCCRLIRDHKHESVFQPSKPESMTGKEGSVTSQNRAAHLELKIEQRHRPLPIWCTSSCSSCALNQMNADRPVYPPDRQFQSGEESDLSSCGREGDTSTLHAPGTTLRRLEDLMCVGNRRPRTSATWRVRQDRQAETHQRAPRGQLRPTAPTPHHWHSPRSPEFIHFLHAAAVT